MAVATIIVVVVAITVGVLVGVLAEDWEPDAEFEWSEETVDGELIVTLEKVAGPDDPAGGDMQMHADGVGDLGNSTSLSGWGTVTNGSTLQIGLVETVIVDGDDFEPIDTDALDEADDGDFNETQEEQLRQLGQSQDVIAVAYEDQELADGDLLMEAPGDDVTMADLDSVSVTWHTTGFSTELTDHVVGTADDDD